MQSGHIKNSTIHRDYNLWQKYSSAYSSIVLPSIQLEDHLSNLFAIIYSSSYQTRYSLILEVYFENLTGIDLISAENLLMNLYNFVTPVSLENPDLEFTILLPQLTKVDTILTRTITPSLDIVFEHKEFSLNTSNYHKGVAVSCKIEQLNLIPTDITPSAYYVKLDPSIPRRELKSQDRSCLGGTYDHLHNGHKLFLSFADLVSKDYMLIGLTSDELLTKKTHRSAIECFETRHANTTKFINYFDPGLKKLDVVPINDPAGPAKDGDFTAIVVTKETVKGGDYVNNLRREGGYKELEVIVANVVSNTGQIQDKLSSTGVREIIMAKVEGRDDILETLYKEWNELMESLNITNKGFIGLWFDKLKKKYSESWRFYHTLTHVWYLLKMCNEHAKDVQELDVVKLTAWFHDVIYIPQNPNNEKDSVTFFEEFIKDLEEKKAGGHLLTVEKQEKIKKIILYTINHTQTAPEAKDWFDAKFFLDIDLGILGGEEEDYAKYAKNVRKEYCLVPDETFREKRAEFMSRFLNKDLIIYKTELFKNKLEEKAFSNIKKEVEELLGKNEKSNCIIKERVVCM